MKSIKIFGILTSGFGHNKTERFCSEMSRAYKGDVAQNVGTCSLTRLKKRERIHLRIGE